MPLFIFESPPMKVSGERKLESGLQKENSLQKRSLNFSSEIVNGILQIEFYQLFRKAKWFF